jgi:hypothetical protein
MLREDENIKDPNLTQNIAIKDKDFPISYSKPDKLITALYMVTDIMDEHEPIRSKLRNLGIEIVSDIYHNPIQALPKISQVMSFLEMASTLKLISEMNRNILSREFLKLEESIKEYGKIKSNWLEEFSLDSAKTSPDRINRDGATLLYHEQSYIGHEQSLRTSKTSTRIGVQKGSTLMKALSDKTSTMSDRSPLNKNSFDLLKKQRREDIITIIKKNPEGLTITDIRTKAKEFPKQTESLISCGEKTLQRELLSMLRDGVLYKTGEKRWSRYFIKN